MICLELRGRAAPLSCVQSYVCCQLRYHAAHQYAVYHTFRTSDACRLCVCTVPACTARQRLPARHHDELERLASPTHAMCTLLHGKPRATRVAHAHTDAHSPRHCSLRHTLRSCKLLLHCAVSRRRGRGLIFCQTPSTHTSGCVQAAKRCSWAGTRECIVLRVQRAVNTLRWQPDNTGTATRTASLRLASTAYGVHSVLGRTCAHVPSSNSMPSFSAVPAASVANIHIACGFVDPYCVHRWLFSSRSNVHRNRLPARWHEHSTLHCGTRGAGRTCRSPSPSRP